MGAFKLKLLRACYVGGRVHTAGEIIDADARTANDLRHEAAAELLDPREAPRLRELVRELCGTELRAAERSQRAAWNVTREAADPGPWRKLR